MDEQTLFFWIVLDLLDGAFFWFKNLQGRFYGVECGDEPGPVHLGNIKPDREVRKLEGDFLGQRSASVYDCIRFAHILKVHHHLQDLTKRKAQIEEHDFLFLDEIARFLLPANLKILTTSLPFPGLVLR